uniref:NADH-ubiquinone oxidoreductase chain 4L n=1 Tax=Embiophila sp. TaxID=2931291 RepID=A0A8T9ZY42_9HEMI|nr:NADH dehydrogenase subunit 4L [Embiophila sp.]
MFMLISLMFVSGVLVFISTRKHLLLTLLSIEYLVLSLFMLFYMVMFVSGVGGFMIFLFLTFSVCEGVLGLSILVSLIRLHGNDTLKSISFVSW